MFKTSDKILKKARKNSQPKEYFKIKMCLEIANVRSLFIVGHSKEIFKSFRHKENGSWSDGLVGEVPVGQG